MIDLPGPPRIVIPDAELTVRFVHASGPGGQHVNKVATACQLRFDAARSPSLPDDVRARLLRLAGRRATADGVIVIDARRYRSRERNREDAEARLARLVERALHRPRPRRATRPNRAARERRLAEKKRRAEIKRRRRPLVGDD